jgi:hypothetical protein
MVDNSINREYENKKTKLVRNKLYPEQEERITELCFPLLEDIDS